ncbi:Rieske (2Fe-2S) protein [Haloplanus ruber]|uniref:Rieske (2Fe-2S) protein n=1 Tax=Haloplanus ruber TaxID=869892 RepID=A0ABD6CWS2_9EURY|nr:Rieske 2Fe-2S domain-containing protein [Haloplanus ruber]
MTEEGATDGHRIAPVEDLPDGGTARFEATAGRRQIEGILKRDGTAVVGYRNSCPHEPEVKLDRGLGALVDGDQLVCHKHGARFDCADGYCTRGPPRGRSLDTIEVTVRDGTVFLTDERFDGGRRID